jgi:hypothetical protein
MGVWNPFRRKCKLRVEPHEYYDNELTEFLQKGDIILYRGEYRSLTSALIMEFTRSPYSHADIYVGDGWCISAERYGLSLEDHCNTEFIDLLRLKSGLSREQRAIVLEKAYQSLAKPYEYLGLLGFPFGSEKAAARRSANQAYICSEVTAWCYKEAGIDLIQDRPEAIEAPADLARSPELEWLGAWKAGRPFPGAEHNKFHKLQLNKKAGFAKWLVKNVADLLSERDEYYEKLRDEQATGSRQEHYGKIEQVFRTALRKSRRLLQEAAD